MNLGEGVIINGTGVQTTTNSRWGDYTSMNIDPVDDCTFWYVNEYYEVSGLPLPCRLRRCLRRERRRPGRPVSLASSCRDARRSRTRYFMSPRLFGWGDLRGRCAAALGYGRANMLNAGLQVTGESKRVRIPLMTARRSDRRGIALACAHTSGLRGTSDG